MLCSRIAETVRRKAVCAEMLCQSNWSCLTGHRGLARKMLVEANGEKCMFEVVQWKPKGEKVEGVNSK